MKNKKYLKESRILNSREMKKFNLSNKEVEEVKNIDKGIYESVSNKKLSEYKKMQADFKNSKTQPILIRFDVQDLKIIKKKAESEGLPYQSFIKSIVHKAITQ